MRVLGSRLRDSPDGAVSNDSSDPERLASGEDTSAADTNIDGTRPASTTPPPRRLGFCARIASSSEAALSSEPDRRSVTRRSWAALARGVPAGMMATTCSSPPAGNQNQNHGGRKE